MVSYRLLFRLLPSTDFDVASIAKSARLSVMAKSPAETALKEDVHVSAVMRIKYMVTIILAPPSVVPRVREMTVQQSS